MGIRTVAVYSDADAKALHIRQAGAKLRVCRLQSRDDLSRMRGA